MRSRYHIGLPHRIQSPFYGRIIRLDPMLLNPLRLGFLILHECVDEQDYNDGSQNDHPIGDLNARYRCFPAKPFHDFRPQIGRLSWRPRRLHPRRSFKRERASSVIPLPRCPHTRKELLTIAIQRALQHLLKPFQMDGLRQRRPVAIGLGRLAIARGKDEWRAAGNEGIGNRRDGLAVEIGVEDRKVEIRAS